MLASIGKKLRLFSRFSADRKAAAAVEFALIAGPLVLMICASIELAMVFLVDVTLDNATSMAARAVRTGNDTSSSLSQAQFKQAICNNMGWLSASCPTSLYVDVNTYSTFAAVATAPSPYSSNTLTGATWNYNTGSGSDIVMVRAYYDWPLFTPILNAGLSTLSNGDALLTAQVVFRNEPF